KMNESVARLPIVTGWSEVLGRGVECLPDFVGWALGMTGPPESGHGRRLRRCRRSSSERTRSPRTQEWYRGYEVRLGLGGIGTTGAVVLAVSRPIDGSNSYDLGPVSREGNAPGARAVLEVGLQTNDVKPCRRPQYLAK